MVVRLYIRMMIGKKFPTDLTDEQFGRTTVLRLKGELPSFKGTPADYQQLIHSGKFVKKDRLLSDCEIKDKSFFYMLTHKRGGRPVDPRNEVGGMGDKRGKSRSMEKLSDF